MYGVMAVNAKSRSSHEERGLKLAYRLLLVGLFCRSSHEERGLKSTPPWLYGLLAPSLLA